MSEKKFRAILIIILPQLTEIICKNYDCSEEEAAKILYNSHLYELLEDEETKMWHYSPQMLFSLLDSEIKTGTFEFPEET